MFTSLQKQVIAGLVKVERKNYTTRDLVDIMRRCDPELRDKNTSDLEFEISKVVYSV